MSIPDRVPVVGFPNTAAARAKLDEAFDRTFGHGFTPGTFDRETQTITVLQERPDASAWTLGSDFRASQIDALSQQARAQGYDLVEVDLHERRAYLAHLTPAAKSIRKRLAAFAKVEPWALEVAVEAEGTRVDQVQILRAPEVSPEHGKRLEFWRNALAAIPGADPQWRVEVDMVSGRVVLTRRTDPLLAILDYPWDAPASMEAIPFAVDEEGIPVTLKVYESNILIGGIPGSGKSGGSTAILAGLARLEHTAIFGIDLKRVELTPWKARMEEVSKTSEDSLDLLNRLLVEMMTRYEWLESQGLKKLSPATFNHERPLIVLVIDELAQLVLSGDKILTDAVKEALRQLVALGRAAGITVITMTQKPETAVIPGTFRDLIAQRVAFATTTPESTDTILGRGSASLGADAHYIPQALKGVNFLTNEESRSARRTRAYWIPDEEVMGIAERTSHLRIGLNLREGDHANLPDPFGGFDDPFGGALAPTTAETSAPTMAFTLPNNVDTVDWDAPTPERASRRGTQRPARTVGDPDRVSEDPFAFLNP